MSVDLYQQARDLAFLLDRKSQDVWAGKFRDCLEGDATGTEIVMCLGLNADQFIQSIAGRDEECRSLADIIRQEVTRLVGKPVTKTPDLP